MPHIFRSGERDNACQSEADPIHLWRHLCLHAELKRAMRNPRGKTVIFGLGNGNGNGWETRNRLKSLEAPIPVENQTVTVASERNVEEEPSAVSEYLLDLRNSLSSSPSRSDLVMNRGGTEDIDACFPLRT